MVEFEKVLKGLEKYICNEMYKNLTDWQIFIADIAVGKIVNRGEALKQVLKNNTIIQMLDVMDEDGNVDVEGLLKEIKHKMEEVGHLSFTLPIFGKYKFSPSDIAVLHKYIMTT